MLRCPDVNPPIRTLFLRHRRIFCHHIQTLRPLPAEQHTDYSLSFYDPPHPILPAALVLKDERKKKSALSMRCHYFLLLFLRLSFDAQSIITPPSHAARMYFLHTPSSCAPLLPSLSCSASLNHLTELTRTHAVSHTERCSHADPGRQ